MLLWKSKLLLRINFTGLTLGLLTNSAGVWVAFRSRHIIPEEKKNNQLAVYWNCLDILVSIREGLLQGTGFDARLSAGGAFVCKITKTQSNFEQQKHPGELSVRESLSKWTQSLNVRSKNTKQKRRQNVLMWPRYMSTHGYQGLVGTISAIILTAPSFIWWETVCTSSSSSSSSKPSRSRTHERAARKNKLMLLTAAETGRAPRTEELTARCRRLWSTDRLDIFCFLLSRNDWQPPSPETRVRKKSVSKLATLSATNKQVRCMFLSPTIHIGFLVLKKTHTHLPGEEAKRRPCGRSRTCHGSLLGHFTGSQGDFKLYFPPPSRRDDGPSFKAQPNCKTKKTKKKKKEKQQREATEPRLPLLPIGWVPGFSLSTVARLVFYWLEVVSITCQRCLSAIVLFQLLIGLFYPFDRT